MPAYAVVAGGACRWCSSSQNVRHLRRKIAALPTTTTMIQPRSFAVFAILAVASACKMSHEAVRADSVHTAEQLKLTNQLAAEKDSLVTVVLDADKFISQIDSQITRVRELALLQTTHNKVFYVIGREDDLLNKGIVVREGGANLLLAHPGRTLQPARTLDASMFTAIDQRAVREIAVPDSSRNYAIVSRQSLDDADVATRDRASFHG